ncbi:U3 small nucleolar RNA-associated protein 25-like [Brassica napus]|uniref:U3 small nucleolar RNA-associated protein 25-like n=1 Tax=Brassica napus TaxID=3708 RepID=UPI0006AA9776|nr:U3 small nucleolar RNA-associated protein 25-like [Brassica napus]
MKNSKARPVGSAPLPEANGVEKKNPNECNYIQNDKRSHDKSRGGYRNRDNYSNGRDRHLAGRKGNHNNRGRGSNPGRGRGSNPGRGRGGYGQESLKDKNPEAHMVHDSGYEADKESDVANDDLMDFETSDCLKD